MLPLSRERKEPRIKFKDSPGISPEIIIFSALERVSSIHSFLLLSSSLLKSGLLSSMKCCVFSFAGFLLRFLFQVSKRFFDTVQALATLYTSSSLRRLRALSFRSLGTGVPFFAFRTPKRKVFFESK